MRSGPKCVEATPRIELGMELLQSSALPLGYVAFGPRFYLRGGRGQTELDLDADRLRDVLAQVPGGVVVVSTRDAQGYRGLTASSFAAASLDPPLVLVCLDRFSATLGAVAAAGAFNVSLLARRQEFLADRFSGRAPAADPAWREVPHRAGANGLPVVEGCSAWFECELNARHEAGDHEVLLGLVRAAGRGQAEPLVHFQRGFWTLS